MYCPRFPRFNEKGPLLSEQLSVDRRGGVLAFIDRYVKEALDLIKQLKTAVDSGRFTDPSAIELELANYEVQLNCAKASALSAVINAVRSPVTVPTEIQETALSRLHNIIRWPRFVELPPGTRISLLTCVARLAKGLGHEEVNKIALTKAHEIGPTDADSATTPSEISYFSPHPPRRLTSSINSSTWHSTRKLAHLSRDADSDVIPSFGIPFRALFATPMNRQRKE